MTSRIGKHPTSEGLEADPHGFTLIEFILVMALLATVFAVSAPSLARFFRGRSLDSEVRRFLALTRYGQNRAVFEGIPMIVWIDQAQRRYGLCAESSYDEADPSAVEFTLAKEIEIEPIQPLRATLDTAPWKRTTQLVGLLPTIRFTPDGFIALSSPEYVLFREGEDSLLWIGQGRNRLTYEIQTNSPAFWSR